MLYRMRVAGDLTQQVHLGSQGRSSPHASSRPPRHLQIAATLDPRSHSIRRVFRHEGKPKTQQVHCWKRCHSPLERNDFVANIFNAVDAVYHAVDKAAFLAERVVQAKPAVSTGLLEILAAYLAIGFDVHRRLAMSHQAIAAGAVAPPVAPSAKRGTIAMLSNNKKNSPHSSST